MAAVTCKPLSALWLAVFVQRRLLSCAILSLYMEHHRIAITSVAIKNTRLSVVYIIKSFTIYMVNNCHASRDKTVVIMKEYVFLILS